jgi:hypothetical protein
MRDGREHLRRADVRAAEHPDLAIRVRQRARPLHRVVPVVGLVLERVPLALGRVAPAHVLDDDHVAARGGAKSELAVAVLVVGRPLQQHRVLPVVFRAVDVGVERDAVTHLDRHVGLERDAVVVGGPNGAEGDKDGARDDEDGLTSIHGAAAYQMTKRVGGRTSVRPSCVRRAELEFGLHG